MELRPVPVIILAQALNGIILPVIAVILFLLMNNSRVLPESYQNGTVQNLLTGIIVWLMILLGLTNLLKAFSRIGNIGLPNQSMIIVLSIFLFLIVIIPVFKSGIVRRSE